MLWSALEGLGILGINASLKRYALSVSQLSSRSALQSPLVGASALARLAIASLSWYRTGWPEGQQPAPLQIHCSAVKQDVSTIITASSCHSDLISGSMGNSGSAVVLLTAAS